jgi:hypothetical protein
MNLKSILTLAIAIASFSALAQTHNIKINGNIRMPKDTLVVTQLVTSLNQFLIAKEQPNDENNIIVHSENVVTYLLLDEMKGIEKSKELKDDFFYKPYLVNCVKLNDDEYYLQISYIGINNQIPILRASFEIIAHKREDTFLFSSPFLKNTKNWKVETIQNTIFHYQTTINKSKIKEYIKLTSFFDKKLKIENKTISFYCCENIIALQKLIGVQYKLDYNGRAESIWSATDKDNKIIVLGNDNATFSHFDPHDLWHDRLSLVVSRNEVNKPVDEGCAYIYGGSWGLSWQEIFKAFKEEVANNRKTNWKAVKETRLNFKTNGFNNSADYIVNALLVKKIEKEKGFEGVWELLNVGPFEAGNEKYYTTLEKLTGITKQNYNEKIWELIDNE